MNEYRRDTGLVAKETAWTFWRFLPIFLVVIVILGVVGFGMRSCGKLGGTIVEREVYEQSYQRTASLEARIATDKATIAQIDGQLKNPNLDENTRFNLEAQKNAAQVRIDTAERQQN